MIYLYIIIYLFFSDLTLARASKIYRTPMNPTETMRYLIPCSVRTKFVTTCGSNSGGVTPSHSAAPNAVGVPSP